MGKYMNLNLRTLSLAFLIVLHGTSFGMRRTNEKQKALHQLVADDGKRIIAQERKKFEALPLKEQGWRNLRRLYKIKINQSL